MYYTDDPVRDANNYFAEKDREEQEATFANCSECGKPIYYGDRYAKEDGEYICEECWTDRLQYAD